MSEQFTEAPNPEAEQPSGMCGSRAKCAECPSDFLCFTKAQAELAIIRTRECASCGEGDPVNECAKSLRPCGHHCNHIWESDYCHWCETEGEADR